MALDDRIKALSRLIKNNLNNSSLIQGPQFYLNYIGEELYLLIFKRKDKNYEMVYCKNTRDIPERELQKVSGEYFHEIKRKIFDSLEIKK